MRVKPKIYRQAVQYGFFFFILYLGFALWRFRAAYDPTAPAPLVSHPDGVEGFLPIGALTSLKYWLVTGTVHPAHPAAMFIFIGAVSVSLVFKKSFCGWICPVGLISDWLRRPFRRLFKKELRLPAWLDYPLRSLKYIIFAFFFLAIAIKMDLASLHGFLDGDYWKVADVKMLMFFMDISALALDVIIVLIMLSLLFKGFWCRYLCPYGALLGLVSLLSPFGISRDADKCIGCRKCARECPASLPVDKKDRVLSPECTSCLSCVSVCPVDALTPTLCPSPSSGGGWLRRRRAGGFKIITLSAPKLAAGILGLFLCIYLVALASGHWHSGVSRDDLKRLVPIAESLEHP